MLTAIENSQKGGEVMRLIIRLMRLAVILMTLVCMPVFSHATEVKMTSSTQYSWYQDFVADKNQNDISEYVRLNLTKLDKEGKASFYAYARVTKQVTSSEDMQGRFYYFYVDYRDAFKDHLDVRAGRTYVNAAAVSGTVDGLFLNVKNLGPVGFTAFGGREVIFQNKQEIGGGNAMTGGSIYLDTVKNTHVEVSYGNKYRDSNFARENVGLDFTTTPCDMANVYGRVKYDTIATEFNELLFGAKLAPLKDLILRIEFLQSRPTFDNNSIYRIFAVDNYKELSAAAEYQLTNEYRINFKYAKEFFGENADADVFDIGLIARPIKDLTVNASYEKRIGYTGQLSGFRLNAGYDIEKAKIQAGIDYDDFTRDESRGGTAKKYWTAASYQFSKMVGATARIEYDVNYINNNSYQGFAAVNINY
jgi:hypothetical protein